jgi:HEAT repeat protein
VTAEHDPHTLGLEALQRILEGADELEGARAAAALGQIGDRRAVASLTGLVNQKHGRHWRDAAVALCRLADPKSLKVVAGLLRSKEASVRAAAAIALGEMDDPRAVDPSSAGRSGSTRAGFT